MLSIRVAGGEAAAIATAARVQLWKRATSLAVLKPDRATAPPSRVPAPLFHPTCCDFRSASRNAGDLIDDLDQALASGN